MGMKQVQEFIMEPKGSVLLVRATLHVSLKNAGKRFFNETEGPTEESAFFHRDFCQPRLRGMNTNAVRVAVRLGSRALQGQKRNISRPRKNSALTPSRVATEISCLFH
ncbi:BCN_G0000060.mRNA.1.CDS.1 [Saccharomyces cerevisiae]|nr:BCN_G0000060.mRNA.1.CDS.1 [Saccharomyces cerevisiae]CAI4235571.1 BCE_3a_G0000060.mRNA.1.CDS.1 [Saccharomyces cerevisiae]CAI4236086.1 AEH_G0000070.mRNA.1.CDS.1 [Saccharomyces cerevisiae]CAI4240958.1 AMP_1a_G0001070.mRNA.1.CDS.1 [Saccharomyces cerevisiae]CAI4240971.1 BDC_1c_G0000900.mRNA.1.CDS.1 [Saccharomyces cerevisiae]